MLQLSFSKPVKRVLQTVALSAAMALPLAMSPVQADSVTVGQTFLASGLDPAEGSTGWALVTHGIGEQLFQVSRTGEIVPNLASSASINSDGSWTVELAPDRFFF